MIKVFKVNAENYNEEMLNNWANEHNYKITDVNVCPTRWYLNNSKTAVSDIDLVITVIYHKKRNKKKEFC